MCIFCSIELEKIAMKKKIYLLILFAVYIFYGCWNNKATDKDFFLDKTIKSEAKQVMIDTVGYFEDLIYAQDFWVYQDSILIVCNKKYADVYFVEFYDLRRQQLLRQLFRLGNGPYELLSAIVTMDGNVLTVNDYVKDQVAFVNIDSVLQNPLYVAPVIRHAYSSPTAVRYKEGQLLLENPYCFKSKELGIDHKASRFVVITDNEPYIESKQYEYTTRNVAVNGKIITDYQKDRIIYADGNKPLLEIYNNELELIKQIHGPDKMLIKYRINEDNSICFNKIIPFVYMNFCTSADFVYLIYLGDFLVPFGQMEDLPAWIFQFDWDGNLIESYSVGRYINSISLSAEPVFSLQNA